MLSCRLQCALAALCIVLALGGVTGAPSDPRLRQFLQKSLAAATGKQELAKYFLAELLSEPNQTENDALEPEDLPQAAEQDEMRLELQRSANSNPAMAPRASCSWQAVVRAPESSVPATAVAFVWLPLSSSELLALHTRRRRNPPPW